MDPTNIWLYTGGDSDQIYIAVRLYEPMTIQDFVPFATAHRVFLLFSNGGIP